MFVRSQFMLVPLSKAFTDLVLRWRNSDWVRGAMFNDAVITAEEHQKWIARILQDRNVRYGVFCFNGLPVGLAYFTQIDRVRGHCSWGFYLGEANLPKGLGTALGYCALEDVFASMGFLQEITGEVLTSNPRSLVLHNKLGFVSKGFGTVERHGKAEKIVLFVLSRDAWSKARSFIAESLFGEKG
jgi:UDP-4-amino-4,6-dideoxy-N-acetyl-beta-L-altrosamine N-acetyltransferase